MQVYQRVHQLSPGTIFLVPRRTSPRASSRACDTRASARCTHFWEPTSPEVHFALPRRRGGMQRPESKCDWVVCSFRFVPDVDQRVKVSRSTQHCLRTCLISSVPSVEGFSGSKRFVCRPVPSWFLIHEKILLTEACFKEVTPIMTPTQLHDQLFLPLFSDQLILSAPRM